MKSYDERLTDLIGRVVLDSCSGAEPTSRLIPGDDGHEYPEWREDATLDDGTPVRIYYRTTPEDAKRAEDWGVWDVPWDERVTRIVELLDDGTDGEDLAQRAQAAAELGRRGGKRTSERKAAAARANGRRGGRAYYCRVCDAHGIVTEIARDDERRDGLCTECREQGEPPEDAGAP